MPACTTLEFTEFSVCDRVGDRDPVRRAIWGWELPRLKSKRDDTTRGVWDTRSAGHAGMSPHSLSSDSVVGAVESTTSGRYMAQPSQLDGLGDEGPADGPEVGVGLALH